MESNRYISLETLHRSHRTEVCRALRKRDRRPVILKLNTGADITDRNRRFHHEYDIGRILEDEYVVRPLSIEASDRTPALVFDDDRMVSLGGFIPPDGFPLHQFLPLALEITSAVEFIHSRNIIHKDINPSNIIVDASLDRAKLIDFELAARIKREEVGIKSVEVLDGTLSYMSPEQTGRVNRSIDYRSDFYSLGVTFYQMITGKLPFPRGDAMAMVHCHIARSPRPVTALSPSTPQVVSDLIEKLMSKTAEDRYQSAFGIRADLAECLHRYQRDKRISDFGLARKDYSGAVQIPQKLYGRDREISALFQLFDRVAGGSSEIVFISGYSGVGKTSLVREVHRPMTERSGHFASGKFNQFQKDTPYFAITQAFNDLCGYFLMEKPDVLALRRAAIREALGQNGQIIVDVVPELERIIGKQPPAPAVGVAEAQHRFEICFKRFVASLCNRDHPLVLFIDDMQWGDRASMNLLKRLMLDSDITHLLIIAAYRDNEVDDNHPLLKMRGDLDKAGVPSGTIDLGNLTAADINALLADSLETTLSRTQPLTELIFQKTGGNAFFTHQLIQTLSSEGLLYFDHRTHEWVWSVQRIAGKKMADNVLDMMSDKLARLSHGTRKALHAAACIGDRFDLRLLSRILAQSPEETMAALNPAVNEGLIQPLNDDYQYAGTLQKARFRFLHDRVHQAAYSMAGAPARQRTHLKIGRLLWKDTPPGAPEETLLDIAEQFSHGIGLVRDQGERDQLARLYLTAGRKAKRATAYREALSYLTTGRDCLADNSFETAYSLSFQLYRETSEAAFLCGDYPALDRHAKTALRHARSLADEARIRKIQIQACIAQNRRKEGIAIALAFLKKLDIHLDPSPTPEAIGGALSDMQRFLADKSVHSFADLPAMRDENLTMAIRIMAATTSAAFVASPGLMVLLILKQVELSIRYGNLPESTYFYVFYGVVLCGIVGDIDTGYQFGLLAAELEKRTRDHRMKAKTDHVFNDLIRPWKEHLRSSLQPLIDNYDAGMELGDVEFAAYSAHIYSCYLFFAGENLDAAEKEIAKYSRAIEAVHQTDTHCWNLICWQTVLNLMGTSPQPCRITGDVHDEGAKLPVYRHANDKMSLCYLFLNKCILCYLFGDYPGAIENAAMVEPHLDGATGKYTVALFHFYDALARLAHYRAMPAREKEAAMERISDHQQKLKAWAGYAPMNFQHKHDLVAAEKSRALGQLEAIIYYEKAISGAKQHGFLQEEALGYELAAGWYLGRDMRKVARTYLSEAFARYARWGAKAKCDHLQKAYPNFLLSAPSPPTPSSSLTEAQLDQQSIIKASQAISSEVKLDQLLDKLISIAIENAGADKGVLIIRDGQGAKIEATRTTGAGPTQTLQHAPIEESAEIPLEMIQSVLQSKETVSVSDASADAICRKSDYIERRRPKSILCMPIIYQRNATGALYLENSRFTGIFTVERVRTLDILISQAAISIENAKLFDTLNRERNYSADIIKKSPGMVCGIAPDGRATFINPAIEVITGYRKEEIVGRNWWDLFYPGETRDQVTTFFDALKKGEVTDYEMALTCKNGEQRVVAWTSLTQRDDGNRMTEIIGFGNDITERKRANEALRESESRLKSILEANPSPVVVYDTRGYPQFVNPGFTEVFGWTLEEIRGRTIPFVPPDEQERTLSEIEGIYRSGHSNRFLTQRYTKHGATLDVIVSAALINRSAGDPAGLVVNITDISEQKLLEHRLSQAQKMESIGRLAGGVAHDFNNMLTIILGNTEMILDDLAPDHPTYGAFNAIREAGGRSTDLVRQLLAFARKQTIVPEPLDFNAALEGMLKMLQRLIGENITLTWLPEKRLWPIKIDPSQIDQVLANLCVNARDAIKGVGEVVIETKNVSFDEDYCRVHRELKPGDYVMMVFSDSGLGMDKETVNHIFEPFFTTKTVGKGTGLGLSTVYGIVKQNDGFINVYSEPDKGTTFKLYFPRYRKSAARRDPESRETAPLTGHETILLVEDEADILEMASLMLQRLGYHVISAASPAEAIQKAEASNRKPVDLLLTDVVMPEMNGRDLSENLLRVYPKLKCLFMSGYTADVIAHHGVLEEGVAFINKPFSLSSLATKVREVLDR